MRGNALVKHARVVVALLLRDIKTRFGATYFGFLLGLLIPFVHIVVVLGIYVFLGRRPPIGTDTIVFLSTAVVPFVVWSYAHQRVLMSFAQNMPLTSFPGVAFIDIFIARSIGELMNSCLIIITVSIMLIVVSNSIIVNDYIVILKSFFMMYLLGISTGYICGMISIVFPSTNILLLTLIPIYWTTSGTMFIPAALPETIRDIIFYFPLSHIVDIVRIGYYSSYVSNFFSEWYVYLVIAINLILALCIERFVLPSAVPR